jgi:hypothetical protein
MLLKVAKHHLALICLCLLHVLLICPKPWHNRSYMLEKGVNANLIDHLSCHDHSYQEELASMTDNRSKNSTLLQSCFVGSPDLTRWILKHTVDDSDKSDIQHGEIDVCSSW